MRHSIQRLHQICSSFQKNLLITHTHKHSLVQHSTSGTVNHHGLHLKQQCTFVKSKWRTIKQHHYIKWLNQIHYFFNLTKVVYYILYKQAVFKNEKPNVMRLIEKEAVGISFTPTCHTHTKTDRTHTQPVPNHTSSDPGLQSFQTVHICSTVILHTVCVTVCACACYPVVFLCKSHISTGPQTLTLVLLRVPKLRQDISIFQWLLVHTYFPSATSVLN